MPALLLHLAATLVVVACLENDANFTAGRADYTAPLTCFDELEGVMEGVEYHQSSSVVECGRVNKYCQKVTAHFISASSETDIVMRGCDPVQIANQFSGISCEVEGCYEETVDQEMYNVCCCTSDLCNASPITRNISLLFVLIAIYIMKI